MADRIDREPKEYEIMMIKANFVGANPSPVMTGFEQMDYKCNYFIGNDPNEWHTDVPNYSAVVYSQLYDGIDLKYYGNGRQMEYDFIVEPGADFSQIKIEYEGAESVSINANGELVVETRWGEVVEQKPVIYQIDNNRHHSVEGIYRLQENNCFGFEVGDYNTDLPLVIDPVLTYSTYLGGSDRDAGWYISVDASGATYIAGSTQSTDFPTLDPFQGTLHHNDCFVTKLNVDGNSLVYSTYLGGSDGWEGPGGIAVDSSGAVYVGGTTSSTDFPTLNPYQGTHYGREGNWDCFVTKLADTGDSLIYSTYLGGGEDERNYGIAIDSSRKLPH